MEMVMVHGLAEDGSRRSRPGAVPDYCFTVDGRRMLYDVKRISFCPSRYWPTVAVEPGHTRDTHTGRAGAQGHTDHTDEPHNHPKPTHNPHVSATAETAADSTAPQARSRPLPAADSTVEAAPSEPDPAFTRSQSASPRLLKGSLRNEGARGRRVAAGGAARATDELETREAEAGKRQAQRPRRSRPGSAASRS